MSWTIGGGRRAACESVVFQPTRLPLQKMDICQRVEESPRRGCSDPADLAVNARDYSCRAADATKERLDAARSTSPRAGLLAATTLSLGRAISYNTRVASQSVFPFALRFLNAE
jgi:hypothetical protein